MAFIEWQESYSVGVPALDEDHRHLIDIINRVDAAERSGASVDWVLRELSDYARDHFRREEDRMAAAGYPDMKDHRREHDAFVEWLETVKTTYGIDPEAHFQLAQTVNAYLRKWLVNHILKSDMAYRDYLA